MQFAILGSCSLQKTNLIFVAIKFFSFLTRVSTPSSKHCNGLMGFFLLKQERTISRPQLNKGNTSARACPGRALMIQESYRLTVTALCHLGWSGNSATRMSSDWLVPITW